MIIAADHVDILGRMSLNELILRIAGGRGDEIEENYVSNIREYAAKVPIYEEPEYKGPRKP
jgi:phospholipid:diacylglycerol acyltransferase